MDLWLDFFSFSFLSLGFVQNILTQNRCQSSKTYISGPTSGHREVYPYQGPGLVLVSELVS